MSRSIELTEEKIRVAKDLIKYLEEDILNPTVSTRGMLEGIIVVCKELINSDF